MGRRPTADTFPERYPCQRLRLRIIRTEVEERHLHVVHRDLADRPVPVACYGGDELFRRLRAVGDLEVGEGEVRWSGGLLQAAANGNGGPQLVEHSFSVGLDESRTGERVEVREPDGERGEVGEGSPGAPLYLSQPLAGDLAVLLRLVYQEAKEYKGYVHKVVGVERNEGKRT